MPTTNFAKVPNNVSAKVGSSGYTAGSHALTLRSGDGAKFPALSAGEWLRVTVIRAAVAYSPLAAASDFTVFKVAAIAGDVLTLDPTPLDGTTDRDYAAGSVVECRTTDGTYQDIHDSVNAVETADATNVKTTSTYANPNFLASLAASKISGVPPDVLSTANTFSAVQIAPLRDKGGAFHSAKAHGATGDGVTDDRTAIQAAISACSTDGGGCVQLPAGTYYVSREIALESNVHLVGIGRGHTKVVVAAGSHSAGVQMAGVDHASVRDLTVDVRTNSPQCNGITIQLTATDGTGVKCTNCKIEGCEILGWDTHQYLVWIQNADRSEVIGNWIDGNVTVRPASSEQEGIEVQGGTNTLILGNWILNVGNSGIDPGGVAVDDESGTPTSPMSLDGCTVIGNTIDGANVGLFIGAQYNATSGTGTARRVKFLGNTVRNCGLYGFWAQLLAGSQMTDIQIAHNTFSSVGGLTNSQGVFFDGDTTNGGTIAAADCRDVVFEHNLVEDVTDASAYGIKVKNFPGVRILDGTVRDVQTNAAAGIQVVSCPDVVIRGVRIEHTKSCGIIVQSSDRAIVTHNEIRDWNAGNESAVGILVQSSSRGILTDNTFYQSVSANDYYNMSIAGTCSLMTVRDNTPLYSLAFSVYSPNANGGSNPGSGTFGVAVGITSKTITDTYCTANSVVRLYQIGGAAPILTEVTPADGAFIVTFKTSTVGDETFAYDISN